MPALMHLLVRYTLGVVAVLGLAGSGAAYADKPGSETSHGWKRGHDKLPPLLNSTMPVDDGSAVDIHTQIFFFFNESIKDSTLAIELREASTDALVESDVEVRGATIIVTPREKLGYSTSYSVESLDPVSDLKGNTASWPLQLSFTTEDIEIPSPPVTYSPADGAFIAPSGEMYKPVSAERTALHALNHSYFPIVTATLPAIFAPPLLNSIQDYVIKKEEMVVANPAQDEFLWIMEGKRHGFDNLTVVLTHTLPGNGAPLHTHVEEEAHILLDGKMRYFLGSEETVVEAPYIVNIPSMVPHAFMNVDDEPARLVGVFPESDSWEYDVLDAHVFADESLPDALTVESISESNQTAEEWLRGWHSPESRKKRLDHYKKEARK